jgi:hypothetical protein
VAWLPRCRHGLQPNHRNVLSFKQLQATIFPALDRHFRFGT